MSVMQGWVLAERGACREPGLGVLVGVWGPLAGVLRWLARAGGTGVAGPQGSVRGLAGRPAHQALQGWDMAALRPLGVRLQWGRRGKRGQACLAAGPQSLGRCLGDTRMFYAGILNGRAPGPWGCRGPLTVQVGR